MTLQGTSTRLRADLTAAAMGVACVAGAVIPTVVRLRYHPSSRMGSIRRLPLAGPMLAVSMTLAVLCMQTRFSLPFLALIALSFAVLRLRGGRAADGMLTAQWSVRERRYRDLVERARDVIFETDLSGKWTYLNPAWEVMTGHQAAASIGTSFLTFVVSEDRAGLVEQFAPLYAKTIEACHQEVRFQHASGERRWVSVRSHLLLDATGQIIGTHGTLHDTTERRAMEQNLRDSESLYRLLADNSNDMIVRLDLQGVRKYVSPASVNLLGYEPHELIGLNPAGDIHPDDRSVVVQTCMALIEGDPQQMCVYRQRRSDGDYVWLEANYRLIRNEQGAPVEAIASVRDVSRREIAELERECAAAQVRESHRLLLMAEEMGRIGHWRLDLASQTVFWSDTVCAIHGVPHGHKPPLETAIEVYHPDDRDIITQQVERALQHGEDFANSARIMRPDGSIRHVISQARAEKAPDGTIIGLFGVFQDVTASHEANIKLRQSEHRYKMLSDNATDIVLRLGSDDECLFISPSVAEITGFAPSELLGQRLGARIHHEDAAVVYRTARMLRTAPGPSAIVEFRYRHRDGEWLWLEANLRATPDPGAGTSVDLTGSVRLVDRRKAAEVAAEQARLKLDDSNRLLKMAEGVAHLGHWRIDVLTQALLWSDEVFAIYGLPRETVPTVEATFALYHPDDAVVVRRTVDRAFAAGTGYTSQARINRPDGKLVHITSRCEVDRDTDGKVIGFFGIVQDVTEQRAAEQLLAEREARFRLITEQASDMISLHDANGRVLFMSSASLPVLGYDSSEMLGSTVWDYALAEDDDLLADHRQQLVEQPVGVVCRSRFRMRHRGGRVVWIEAASRRVNYDGQGCSIRVCRDVTEQVRAETELREARGAAEAAAAAKSSFLATMSHEIRTPMTGVLGMVELLRSDVDPGQRDRFFNTLEQSAKTLMTVLDDILDYSKIEAGNLVLETVDFDLAALAHTVRDLFANAASAKGLTLTVKLPFAPIGVRGDPTRIQQVLSNLVSNAIKFTETGGVAIAIKPGSDAARSDRWRIEVIDTGIGIDPAMNELLFSPFVQADPSTTRRFGGTGLGLSISRRLTLAMNGDIGIDPRTGGGSIFWFEVPLAPRQSPDIGRVPRTSFDADDTTMPLRVLVAEDNEVNRLLLTALLRRMGHDPVCVANGELAVAEVTNRYDVVLMDMQMPVMDGVAATRAIRSLPGTVASIPIIALTADALPERRRLYEDIGLTEFLTKPVDIAGLAAALRGLVAPRAPDTCAPEPAAIDADRLAELRVAVGEETIGALMVLIVREASQRPGAIRSLLAAGDMGQAASVAHALHGAANNVGAIRLAKAARAIEHAPDVKNARLALSELDAAADALVRSLTPAVPDAPLTEYC